MIDKTLTTERLILRKLEPDDAPHIVRLAGDYEVSKMTLNIPHPYPAEIAPEFITNTHKNWENDITYTFGIVRKNDNVFMGVIGVHPEMRHLRAEVGYWIGVEFWGKGYMTEALKRVIQFGFEDLNLNRVGASHLISNPASGRVMEKAGMKHEGTFYKYSVRDGEPMDLHFRAILKDDYDAQNS